jgi:hypothetical protein
VFKQLFEGAYSRVNIPVYTSSSGRPEILELVVKD